MKLMIQEIGLELIPRLQEAKEKIGFKWAEKGIDQRSKLGGAPDWRQEHEVHKCSCGQEIRKEKGIYSW